MEFTLIGLAFVAGYVAAIFTWDKLKSFAVKEEDAVKAKIKGKL